MHANLTLLLEKLKSERGVSVWAKEDGSFYFMEQHGGTSVIFDGYLKNLLRLVEMYLWKGIERGEEKKTQEENR